MPYLVISMTRLLSVMRYPEYIRLAWWRWAVPVRVRWSGVDSSSTASFAGMPIISLFPESRIKIGERVSLCSNSAYTALGVNHAIVLRTLRPNSVIEIGDDTGISGATICAAELVSIGKECLIGANVTIVDTDFHAIKPQGRRGNSNPADIAASPVRIGDNVFIGTGAIILKGVVIGDDSVIGAGAVVVDDVPAGHIAAGNPAKVLRSLYAERPCL